MRLLENESTMGTIKVQNGTPVGSESMCTTCRYARIIQGFSESEEIVFCELAYQSFQVPFRVRECSEYDDKRLPRRYDMEKIAYILLSKTVGRDIGFVTPDEFKKLEDEGR
jgi:hypothetical protein